MTKKNRTSFMNDPLLNLLSQRVSLTKIQGLLVLQGLFVWFIFLEIVICALCFLGKSDEKKKKKKKKQI